MLSWLPRSSVCSCAEWKEETPVVRVPQQFETKLQCTLWASAAFALTHAFRQKGGNKGRSDETTCFMKGGKAESVDTSDRSTPRIAYHIAVHIVCASLQASHYCQEGTKVQPKLNSLLGSAHADGRVVKFASLFSFILMLRLWRASCVPKLFETDKRTCCPFLFIACVQRTLFDEPAKHSF
jgi:hypothetical protein